MCENEVKQSLSCVIYYLPSWIKFSPHNDGHVDEILLFPEPHWRGPKSL